MTPTFRRIAVSGSAAVALLGGAAAITVTTTQPATAVESTTVIERAVTAPVTMPDGRTVRVTGMGGYGHKATAEHVATVAGYSSSDDPAGVGTGLTPDGGQGAPLDNPLRQTPADYTQQMQTQAGGGTISVTVAIGIALLAIVIVMVRKGHVKFAQAVACVALGVYLAPTFVGPLIQQLGGSLGGSLGNVWSSF